MRIALLSDIHGNTIALDAVLEDIQSLGKLDEYWILGDMAAIGYDPVGSLEHLSSLSNAHFTCGNTEHYIVYSEFPGPTPEEVLSRPELLPAFRHVAQSFAWTQGAVTAAGWLPWLAALPQERRFVLPDGTRLLGIHASPGNIDGTGIHPGQSEDEVLSLLSGCEADLVCVGHTHWPMDIRIGGVRLINPGSVSNPFPPDLRASYVILETDESGYHLQHRYVDYDHEAVIVATHSVKHPAADYITRFMRGQNQPGWRR